MLAKRRNAGPVGPLGQVPSRRGACLAQTQTFMLPLSLVERVPLTGWPAAPV